MKVLLAFVIGWLYAAGLFLMLRRSMMKLILGLVLLSNAANLLIFTVAGLTPARAPLIPQGAEGLTAPSADPLPQALILTAIVISLGVLAFTFVLVYRAYQTVGTDDLNRFNTTDT